MECIATRQLTYRCDDGHECPLELQLGRPYQESGAWCCDYALSGPYTYRGRALGEDALQALQLAQAALSAQLSAPALQDRVTWHGWENCGLPVYAGTVRTSVPKSPV